MEVVLAIGDLVKLAEDLRTDQLLSTREVAEMLDATPEDVRGWVQEDLIAAERVGGRLVFRKRAILLWQIRGRGMVAERMTR